MAGRRRAGSEFATSVNSHVTSRQIDFGQFSGWVEAWKGPELLTKGVFC